MNPKLIVVGAAGRMGQRILSLAIDAGSFEIIAAIDKKNVGKDVGLMAGGDAIGVEAGAPRCRCEQLVLMR